jgi:methionyl-tRNA formyltransferase
LYNYLTCRKFSITTGANLLIIDNINSLAFKARIQPGDHGIVAGFNQIFQKDTISLFKSLVNFHPSLLPFYRGPVPSFWCIHNGEEQSGYTLHAITEYIDAGDILFQEVVPIDKDDDESRLDQKIAHLGALTMYKYLRCIVDAVSLRKVCVDAAGCYKNHFGYSSFPDKSDLI